MTYKIIPESLIRLAVYTTGSIVVCLVVSAEVNIGLAASSFASILLDVALSVGILSDAVNTGWQQCPEVDSGLTASSPAGLAWTSGIIQSSI